jgi:hypothetical protein
MWFCIGIFSENAWKKFNFHQNMAYVRLCLSQLFVAQEILQKNKLYRNSWHIGYSIFFFRKLCQLWDNVGKYGTVRQATDDNKMRRMRIACWVNTATSTHWEFVVLIAFPLQKRTQLNVAFVRIYIASLVPIYPDVDLSESDSYVLYECLTQKHAYSNFTISQ